MKPHYYSYSFCFNALKKRTLKVFILLNCFSLLLIRPSFAEEKLKTAESSAKRGDYKTAYGILLQLYASQNQELENSRQLIEFYRNKLKKMESNPQVDASYERSEAAKRLWREAYNLQRTAVFTKVGREKEDMLEDAIAKYREITANYPETKEAEEAQYRIGRIHLKFLKNRQRAKEEFGKYLELYPQGEYAEEIKKEVGS
jgi:outer membrane protein assembly factor BamD (BamD/ComL family)